MRCKEGCGARCVCSEGGGVWGVDCFRAQGRTFRDEEAMPAKHRDSAKEPLP